jgi:ATP-dependent Clp protease adapter protein ClpS
MRPARWQRDARHRIEKAFDMKPAQAFKTMMSVHRSGQSSVGPYAAEEAARRIGLANQIAAKAGAPLRLELRAVRS